MRLVAAIAVGLFALAGTAAAAVPHGSATVPAVRVPAPDYQGG
jgi:hypothetical protein